MFQYLYIKIIKLNLRNIQLLLQEQLNTFYNFMTIYNLNNKKYKNSHISMYIVYIF